MKIKLIVIFSSLLFITSCALKPITSEYTFIKTDLAKINLDNLGEGTILVYNGANIFHKMDNTARLNIWINGRALGQIRAGEYVIINLKDGKYQCTRCYK